MQTVLPLTITSDVLMAHRGQGLESVDLSLSTHWNLGPLKYPHASQPPAQSNWNR